MAKEGKVSGVEKAAILLMNMGEELASEVFKHLSPAEIQLLGGIIAKMETVPTDLGKRVINDFSDVATKSDVAVEGLEFAKSLIVKSLGHEKGRHVVEQITREMSGTGIESLKWMDPGVLANLIKSEHPQIIALILIHLDPDKAAQVLLNLPEERVRGEVMLRVATLQRIPQAAVRDLEVLISEQLITSSTSQGSTVEGVKLAAEIMNQVESKTEEAIMGVIEKASPDLAQKIQDKMFVFADLITIDDKGMQQIIKEITGDILTVALKGADDDLKAKFFKNMSERAAEMLKEDLESKGPMKLSDVEKAQQEIIKITRKLEQEGKVVRAGKGGGDVLI
jgi:flagellar motor switch protein FliG